MAILSASMLSTPLIGSIWLRYFDIFPSLTVSLWFSSKMSEKIEKIENGPLADVRCSSNFTNLENWLPEQYCGRTSPENENWRSYGHFKMSLTFFVVIVFFFSLKKWKYVNLDPLLMSVAPETLPTWRTGYLSYSVEGLSLKMKIDFTVTILRWVWRFFVDFRWFSLIFWKIQ